jgi:hypothetical protein
VHVRKAHETVGVSPVAAAQIAVACHPGESRDPMADHSVPMQQHLTRAQHLLDRRHRQWIPAFAGMIAWLDLFRQQPDHAD